MSWLKSIQALHSKTECKAHFTPIGFALIVVCAKIIYRTCTERFAGVPIDYGQVAHINIVP